MNPKSTNYSFLMNYIRIRSYLTFHFNQTK